MPDLDLKYSALRRAVIENEFQNLNDMQRKAVFKTEGPLLLLAGAGSGKTTVLINRVIHLLRFGRAYESELAPSSAGPEHLKALAQLVGDSESQPAHVVDALCAVEPPKPWEILAITFTNKAAGELRERLEVACGEVARDIWAQTFHTACLRILRPHIDRLGYSKSFTIYDEDDKRRLLKDIIKELGFDEKRFEPKAVAGEISRAKDTLLSPEVYAGQNEHDYYKKTVARLYLEYQKRMKLANALDFDDIICLTVELLQTQPDLLESYQRKFRYVLVDEYQDTNHAQYVLCGLLAGGWRNLCVVGDDDQSIYRFRGATIANILNFEEEYPDAVSIRLEQNYRSTANILNAANQVISNNFGRKGKTLWTDKGDGQKVRLFVGESQEEEAQYIAQKIYEGYSQGEKLRDFCVLYRNHALSQNLESAFARSGIPYRIVKGLRFLDRAEVKDMLAYLWLVCNPSDSVRMSRIINNPPRKLGAKTVSTLYSVADSHGISPFGAAENAHLFPELQKSADKLKAFTDIVNGVIAERFTLPLVDLYDKLLQDTGYLPALQEENSSEAQGRIENILELKSLMVDYTHRVPEPSLEGFMEEIALLADIDRFDPDADAVTLMTMHSAKGLEFDHVFLCGIEEGLFPSYRSMESEDEIEEERRLCYVAMTRAKKNLTLTCAKRRLIYGQTSYAKPSRFTAEIPEEHLETIAPRVSPASLYEPRRAAKTPIGASFPKPSVASYSGPMSPSTRSTSGGGTSQSGLRIGDRIAHKAFGQGVVKATTPTGGDILLEIDFDGHGTKLMMAKTGMQFITKL